MTQANRWLALPAAPLPARRRPPDTRPAPFDAVTSTRYRKSGFVATGAVALVLLFGAWLAGWLARRWGGRWTVPPWWQAWLPGSLALLLAVPFITRSFNQPTLPAPSTGNVFGFAPSTALTAWTLAALLAAAACARRRRLGRQRPGGVVGSG